MRRFILVVLGLFILVTGSFSLLALEERDFRGGLKDILLRESDPAKEDEIAAYTKRAGLPLSRAVTEMELIVAESLLKANEDVEDRVLCKLTLDVLGRMGRSESLPVIRRATFSEKRNLRAAAVRAYVRISREDSISFASSVVTNSTRFGPYERRILYEQVAEHAAESKNEDLKKKRDAVRTFLVEAIQKEFDADAANKLDHILTEVMPSYKSSVQRELVAKRFINAKEDVYRKYFTDVEKNLRRMPQAERVDLSKEQGSGASRGHPESAD